jgi:LytS/YehU family sensor histidine kinase
VNYGIFRLFAPEMRPQIGGTIYLADTIHWFWIYAAQLGIVFALDYSRAVADHERRIAVLDRLAHQAQLRALRYQLNPHFMFNTLNSIATLVRRGDAEMAEGMIEDLADFLRATLAVAPNEDIPLARELELQALYLAIETKRFPGRLRVEMDVSPESARALVPSLITQPLTENVIRHAVSASRASVLLSILARRVEDQLHLTIANSSPDRTADAKGMNVGLTNVAERLRVRFDGNCFFSAGLRPDGGFAAEIHLPFVVAR